MEITLTVQIGDYDGPDLQEQIEREVSARLTDHFIGRLTEGIDANISEAVDNEMTGHIKKSIAELLEGKLEIKSTGSSFDRSEKVTLTEYIQRRLDQRDPYSPNRNDKSLPALVDATLAKNWNAELKAGTQRLRDKIDEIINSTIEETITGDIRAKLRKVLAQ